jgi:phospholipid/cholesterol/gamma-HCH transport system permease protein
MGLRQMTSALIDPVIFIGRVSSVLPQLLKRRGIRKREFLYYLDLCGAKSLPTALLICFLTGLILVIQAALQLRKVGTEIFIVDLVGFSILKEFGPLMVAFIAIGRAGSAFAAEIGTMKVNEEIHALETLGITPESYLVMPKLAAMLIAMPLLTIFGDIAGVAGGFVVGTSALHIPFAAYWERTTTVLAVSTFLVGLCKSFIFAILITLAGCYCGSRTSEDAQGVGRGATNAVVTSIFLVVIADTVITLLFSFIGY